MANTNSGRGLQEPSEALALEEQQRADALAVQIEQISQTPSRPLFNSLPLYRDAAGNAAQHTAQPQADGWWTR